MMYQPRELLNDMKDWRLALLYSVGGSLTAIGVGVIVYGVIRQYA